MNFHKTEEEKTYGILRDIARMDAHNVKTVVATTSKIWSMHSSHHEIELDFQAAKEMKEVIESYKKRLKEKVK